MKCLIDRQAYAHFIYVRIFFLIKRDISCDGNIQGSRPSPGPRYQGSRHIVMDPVVQSSIEFIVSLSSQQILND